MRDARRSFAHAILGYRWLAVAWMVIITPTSGGALRFPAAAWLAIAFAVAWTIRLTLEADGHARSATLWIDLGVSLALVLLSGVVAERGALVNGSPLFASAYPIAAALLWGAEWGTPAGAAAGALLALATMFARPLDGVAIDTLQSGEVQSLLTTLGLFIVAGAGAGMVAGLLDRARDPETPRPDERENRVRELARETLGAVAVRASELAAARRVDRTAIADLARDAADARAQIDALFEPPVSVSSGSVSLREKLEEIARSEGHTTVSVSTVGSMLLEPSAAETVLARVRQALDQTLRGNGDGRASVFAAIEDGALTISVRDDRSGEAIDIAIPVRPA